MRNESEIRDRLREFDGEDAAVPESRLRVRGRARIEALIWSLGFDPSKHFHIDEEGKFRIHEDVFEPDGEYGQPLFRRVSSGGTVKVITTDNGATVYKLRTTGFSVVETDQSEYEVRL